MTTPTAPRRRGRRWPAILAGHLSQTADNLMDTGAALVHAANHYAQTDAEARAEFERRKREIGTVQ